MAVPSRVTLFLLFCLVSISANNVHATSVSCDYDLTESIPEGLVYPAGSPSFNSTFDELVNMVKGAQETLDIASFYWSLKGTDVMPNPDGSSLQGEVLLETLVEAAKRGVKVRVAVDMSRRDNLTSNYDLKVLSNAGAQLRMVNFTKLVGAGVLHTKFTIADNRTFYVGSANMDWRSLTQVKELGISVRDCPALATDLWKIFEVYWLLGEAVSIPSQFPDYLSTDINVNSPLAMKLGEDEMSVFLSSGPKAFDPLGRTDDIDAVLSVINSAQKFIYIAVMDYYPMFLYSRPSRYWPVIDNALRTAVVERKVQVRLLASHWQSTRRSMFSFLKSLDAFYNYNNKHGTMATKLFKVPATPAQQLIPFARVNHNKYMVTDQVAYIGTSNWSADYFTNTGGVGFVARAKNSTSEQGHSLRQKLVKVFERDWYSDYAHYIKDYEETLANSP